MTSGIILILAVLILGGVIATVGDRLGTRVGKARLSLFNLRPRRTATLITILTGGIIASTTLAVLFAASDHLRTGVFELDNIQRRLRRTRSELDEARSQKSGVEKALEQARRDQAGVNNQLSQTRNQLDGARQSLDRAIAEREQTQAEKTRIEAELGQTRSQLAAVSQQAGTLRSEINQLQSERNQIIAQRDQALAERDTQIEARDQVIAQRETRLKELENQQEFLAREISRLEQVAQGLRQGNVAVLRGQVLASGVVRIVNPSVARQAVDQLLREANRTATQFIRPGDDNSDQIIQITKLEVDQLAQQIDNGKDYVVRILAAANYLLGETTPVQVFAEAVPNQVVFQSGDLVASTSLTPSTLSNEQLQQRINLLLAAANFRARRMGILTDTIQIDRVDKLVSFIESIKSYQQPIELRIVAADVAYTAGPLRVQLVAAQNGRVLPPPQNET